jgi:hypothetical protein
MGHNQEIHRCYREWDSNTGQWVVKTTLDAEIERCNQWIAANPNHPDVQHWITHRDHCSKHRGWMLNGYTRTYHDPTRGQVTFQSRGYLSSDREQMVANFNGAMRDTITGNGAASEQKFTAAFELYKNNLDPDRGGMIGQARGIDVWFRTPSAATIKTSRDSTTSSRTVSRRKSG